MAYLGGSLQQTVAQKTVLSQMQRQSVELLHLTGPELQSAVDEALAANPLLDVASIDGGPQCAGNEEPSGAPADRPQPFDEPAGVANDYREPSLLNWRTTPAQEEDWDPYARLGAETSLTDFLLEQAGCLALSAVDRTLLTWLIGNLDENGFLAEDFEELTAACPTQPEDPEAWRTALALLQSFDPAGIGARDAVDALILQLKRKTREGAPQGAVAVELLTHARSELARRDLKAAARAAGCTIEEAREAFTLICTLDPHPASAFSSVDKDLCIIPEIVVRRNADVWRVTLNPAVVPHLTFDEESFALLTQAKLSGDENKDWKKKAGEAKAFVRAVEQRFSTIAAVAQCIVEHQSAFFTEGPRALKPLGLKAIADKLGMSESTVSRAAAGKYMQTPVGTFEFKYFFSSALETEDGSAASSAAVRRRIVELVAAEDPKKPLSDGAIAEKLASEGITVARRTVAKYRELEHIAPKSIRKSILPAS